MTGALDNAGTVTVSAGTLRIGDGVTGPGAVAPSAFIVNAALEFDTPLGVNMSAGTSGTGSLTVGGGGLIALGPDLTHQGATTVNAGSLVGRIFNNALLTIAAGATVETERFQRWARSRAPGRSTAIRRALRSRGRRQYVHDVLGHLGRLGPFEKVGSGTQTLTGAFCSAAR